MTARIYHRTAQVKGRKIFYREAGDLAAPTILLLHGLPTSSQMFRDLMPALADRFHLIAPDYVGFGHSDAPLRGELSYTFDNLAAHVAGLVDVLGLTSYILYMQDYGGPVGFRLFSQRPERVKGFIIQNANAYMEGVGDGPKAVLLPLWENRTPETEKPARDFISVEGTKFHWLVGAKDRAAINPDNWVFDQALLDRPGVQDYQVDLLEDYKSNIALYPEWQAAFRVHEPKTLIVWGKHDPFFIPPGARAYLNDLPEAKLVWLDAGHFVLDENALQVAQRLLEVAVAQPVTALPTDRPEHDLTLEVAPLEVRRRPASSTTQTHPGRLRQGLQQSPIADGEGYFGMLTEHTASIEVMPYTKILHDAKVRNEAFFKHLGLN